jgi:hypothetical protein
VLRDGAASANLLDRGEHSVQNVITLFKFVLFVIIVFRVRTQLWQVVLISWVVPVISVPLFGVNGTDRRGQTFSQLPEDRGGKLLIPSDSSQLVPAGAASVRAARHANLLGLPVDLRIVFLELGVTKDDVLLPKPGDGKLDALGTPFVVNHHINYTGDAARLVWAAVHIENRDGLR